MSRPTDRLLAHDGIEAPHDPRTCLATSITTASRNRRLWLLYKCTTGGSDAPQGVTMSPWVGAADEVSPSRAMDDPTRPHRGELKSSSST